MLSNTTLVLEILQGKKTKGKPCGRDSSAVLQGELPCSLSFSYFFETATALSRLKSQPGFNS